MLTLGHIHNGHELTLDDKTRRMHIDILGATGTGKSTLLSNIMLSDIKDGRGFVLIDPHGDLAQSIASQIPPHRINDVLYLDPCDPEHAVGFNPLSIDMDPSVLTSHIVSACKKIWSESWGPRLEYILGHAIRLLLCAPNTSLVHLPLLLTDAKYRERLLYHCTDPVVLLFWRVEFPGYSERLRSEALLPIQNKIGQFTSNPMIRAIIGQRSTFDMAELMKENKILIVNLSKRMGEETSHLLGALLAIGVIQAAQSRATIPEEERNDYGFIIDEFQNYATPSFASALSEVRKYRLNLVLAHQFLKQIPEVVREAVLGNVATLCVFRVGATDAPIIAEQLDYPNRRVLSSTSNHQMWVRTFIKGTPTEPLLVHTDPPPIPQESSLSEVIARTRSRYTRRKEDVEASLASLFPAPPQPKLKKRPPRWTYKPKTV